MKKLPKTRLADKLHHGFVWTCMGITGLAFLNIVAKGIEYYVFIRPQRKIEQAKLEQGLLNEGMATPVTEELAA